MRTSLLVSYAFKHGILSGLFVLGALVLGAPSQGQPIRAVQSDYVVTQRYYDSLFQKPEPLLAQLSLFANLMPKGGDLHHHYSGALYAETYLDWVERHNYCVKRADYKIDFDTRLTESDDCLTAPKVRKDDVFYRELLMKWSNKDYSNHFHQTLPPDQQFFNTFSFFTGIAKAYYKDGLQQLKLRAKSENLQYIETMLARAPQSRPSEADATLDQLNAVSSDVEIESAFDAARNRLENDSDMQQKIDRFATEIVRITEGLDDAEFMLRAQAYVARNASPSSVFSSMYAGFKATEKTDKLVGLNIVGPENEHIAMRDYRLHMKMFRYFKSKAPNVPLALHAGELTIGMVPPEGLRDHIRDAVDIAGAQRIGHGIDVAYEAEADALLRHLSVKKIPVEINLTSNAFIAGVKGAQHPVTLYMQHGVPIVISTDDAGVSRSSISHEYLLFMSGYRPSYATVKSTVYNSLRYAFLSMAEKEKQSRLLDARFAKFEKDTAYMVRNLPH